MRTRITMIAILVAAIGAIVVVWKIPRSSRTASATALPEASSSGPITQEHPKAKPAAKSPAEGGKPSPACFECQKRECWNLIDGCSTLSGNAAGGPKAGTPRKKLCEQMLEC